MERPGSWRSLHDLEPDLSRHLDGLVHKGIDETSYCKGYKYITVIVNHDTNTVVWAADGHGKAVLSKFYGQLTDKQKASIKVVTGDGARNLTENQQVKLAMIQAKDSQLYRGISSDTSLALT